MLGCWKFDGDFAVSKEMVAWRSENLRCKWELKFGSMEKVRSTASHGIRVFCEDGGDGRGSCRGGV